MVCLSLKDSYQDNGVRPDGISFPQRLLPGQRSEKATWVFGTRVAWWAGTQLGTCALCQQQRGWEGRRHPAACRRYPMPSLLPLLMLPTLTHETLLIFHSASGTKWLQVLCRSLHLCLPSCVSTHSITFTILEVPNCQTPWVQTLGSTYYVFKAVHHGYQ